MQTLPNEEERDVAGLRGADVARILGVSRQRVVQLANAGRIKHERTILGRVYDAEDVERLRREREASVA